MKSFTIASCMLLLASAINAKPGVPYEIFPVPQSQKLLDKNASLTSDVNIVIEPGIDKATVDRAISILKEKGLSPKLSDKVIDNKTNLLLGIQGSGAAVDNKANEMDLNFEVFRLPKYDRHIVSLNSNDNNVAQLLVLGENTDAVFYGLASIEQMLNNGTDDLECVTIYDYADQGSRGVIEGYYGVPYTADVTKDLFRFMARNKMNTYMYGAKSDPYHTRYWDEPYPTSITPEQQRIGYLTRDMLRDIVDEAHASKVNFIWAIHPGNAFIDEDATDVNERIMNKFQDMYDLGVRQFGVFVDDVGVPYDSTTQLRGADRLTELQNMIDERWNKNATNPADTVKPLQYVPQLYAYSWTTPDKAQGFFESLSGTPDKIDIYITGANVWSVPNSRDLEKVSQWLGRDVAWWWNYPCNDNDMTKLFMMDTYSNFHDEKHISNKARMENHLKGARTLIANPMQQGEASKIALFSVGDYAWNNMAFDNEKSWLAAIKAVVGPDKAGDLFKVLPYLRYYDETTLLPLVESYKTSIENGSPNPTILINELSTALEACRSLKELEGSKVESNRLFYEDIRPWVNKLETMLQMTIDLLQGKSVADYPDLDTDAAFSLEVLNGMGEDINLSIRNAEPSAKVLRPFIDWLKDQSK